MEYLAIITSYLQQLKETTVFNLGLVLVLDYHRLQTLITFLQDRLAEWLQGVDQVLQTGAPTWRRLVEGLTDPRVGQKGIVSNIKQDR